MRLRARVASGALTPRKMPRTPRLLRGIFCLHVLRQKTLSPGTFCLSSKATMVIPKNVLRDGRDRDNTALPVARPRSVGKASRYICEIYAARSMRSCWLMGCKACCMP